MMITADEKSLWPKSVKTNAISQERPITNPSLPFQELSNYTPTANSQLARTHYTLSKGEIGGPRVYFTCVSPGGMAWIFFVTLLEFLGSC